MPCVSRSSEATGQGLFKSFQHGTKPSRLVRPCIRPSAGHSGAAWAIWIQSRLTSARLSSVSSSSVYYTSSKNLLSAAASANYKQPNMWDIVWTDPN